MRHCPLRGQFLSACDVCLPVVEDLGLRISQKAWETSDHTGRPMRETASDVKITAAGPDPACAKRGIGIWDIVDTRVT